MIRRTLSLFAVLCVANSVRADIVTLGLPDSYTPGTPFDVSVGLMPVPNLGLYNIELVFSTPGSIVGLLAIDPPAPAGSGYVFSSTANFLGNSLVSGNEYRVILSDFTLNPIGPDVTAGVNDRIGTVTLRPISTLTTPIEVRIDRTSLFVDDADGNNLLTGGALPSGVIAPDTTPNPVPAPAGVVLGVVALGVLAVRRSWRGSGTSPQPDTNT